MKVPYLPRVCLMLSPLLLLSAALAQVGMGVDIPEASSLTISHTIVRFDLSEGVYPPPAFPAYYLPSSPDAEDGPMTLEVFTNLPSWTVDVSFSGLINDEENLMLPASQLEYSMDGGINWNAFSLGQNTIIQGLGPTGTTESHPLSLRLRLLGNELPGHYEATLLFTLATD